MRKGAGIDEGADVGSEDVRRDGRGRFLQCWSFEGFISLSLVALCSMFLY